MGDADGTCGGRADASCEVDFRPRSDTVPDLGRGCRSWSTPIRRRTPRSFPACLIARSAVLPPPPCSVRRSSSSAALRPAPLVPRRIVWTCFILTRPVGSRSGSARSSPSTFPVTRAPAMHGDRAASVPPACSSSAVRSSRPTTRIGSAPAGSLDSATAWWPRARRRWASITSGRGRPMLARCDVRSWTWWPPAADASRVASPAPGSRAGGNEPTGPALFDRAK